MYQTIHKRSLRSAVLLGATSVAALAFAAPALAQETSETVVVTGSRIPQTGLYSASPVTVVGSQEAKLTNATSVASLLQQLPQSIAGESSGLDISSDGQTTVNLRGLGPQRTLVLVDGKRFMPGTIGGFEGGAVNLDEIPAEMIDHVEVVTGGASAVYGSDAMAGVVNIILKKDFEGIQLSGGYQITGHGDGVTTNANVLMGASNDKGDVTLWGGYTHRDPISQGARKFSSETLASDGTKLIAGAANSPAAPHANFLLLGGAYAPDCSFNSTSDPGYKCDLQAASSGSSFNPSCALTHSTTCQFTNPEEFFNFAPYQLNQTGLTRYNLGASGDYQIDKMLDLYSRVLFSQSTTYTQIAPAAAYATLDILGNNPFLTPQQKMQLFGTPTPAATDVETVFAGKRFVEIGPRHNDYTFTSFQGVFGAKGDLGHGWTYDLSMQYGESHREQNAYNYAISTNYKFAVANCAGAPKPAAGAAPCAPWNIFSNDPTATGAFTQATKDYVGVGFLEEDTVKETVVTGSVAGDLGEWGVISPWAKDPVGVALGGEYRQEVASIVPDNTLRNGLALSTSPTKPVSGAFDVKEGFGEVRIPVVQGAPFMEELQLEGGFRYSSYSTFGANRSWKYGGDWAPTQDFKFRAEWQRAVRAPNVNELFVPQALGLISGTDPCKGATPGSQLATLCQETGVPGDGTSPAGCPAKQCNVLAGGNPNLTPEISDTRTFGLVLTPTFMEGFTATIDYYAINVNNEIQTVGFQNILNGCYLLNKSYDPHNLFCQLIHRLPSSGGLGGPTSSFVTDLNTNVGFNHVRGIDFQANYQTDLTDWGMDEGSGSLGINFNGTWQLAWKQNAGAGFPVYDCAGLFGNLCGEPDPKWRHNVRVTWTDDANDLLFSLNWRYIGESHLDTNHFGQTNDIPDDTIHAVSYFDLSSVWTIDDGIELTGGILNLFDKQPPQIDSGIDANANNANTFPDVYDVIGRQYFVNLTLKM